jgi:ArsR family transcriptional regulator
LTADGPGTIVLYMSKYPTVDSEAVAAVLKALSNPHRLQILVRLAKLCTTGAACCEAGSADRCVGEVAKGLGVSPSTVSHHLKELRSSGLITMERRGRNIECSVNGEALEEIEGFFSALLPAGAAGARTRRQPPSRKKKEKEKR